MSGTRQRRAPVVRASKKAMSMKDVPPFSIGDLVVPMRWFKPLHYEVVTPCTVLSVQRDHLCVGGWSITVETTAGNKDLSANIFSHARTMDH